MNKTLAKRHCFWRSVLICILRDKYNLKWQHFKTFSGILFKNLRHNLGSAVLSSLYFTLEVRRVNAVMFYWLYHYCKLGVMCLCCQRGNRAKKRGCLGGRFIIPHDVGKNSQILRNPLKFAFLTIFGCK